MKHSHIRLVSDHQSEKIQLPNQVLGDKRRLTQVLINLVKNAKKFTRKGQIKVQASYNARLQSLIVYVSDTGVGIRK